MATIRSGLDAGIQQPRTAPEPEPITFRNGRANGRAGQQTRANDRKADHASAADGQATDLVAIDPTEDAIALVFAARHADTLRYCHDWGMWLQWNGTRWERERRRLAFHFAREFAREANPEGKATTGKGQHRGRRRTVRPSRSASGDGRVTSGIPIRWLLGTPGGTVDLRTGELRPHRREDHITKQTAVTPAPVLHDDHPLWTHFLEDATEGRQGTAALPAADGRLLPDRRCQRGMPVLRLRPGRQRQGRVPADDREHPGRLRRQRGDGHLHGFARATSTRPILPS